MPPILMPDTRPIYLISAAGMPNFGDEFVTRSWLDWLAKKHPSSEVWIDCIEPGRAAHLFADTHPRLRTTNTLWELAHRWGSGNPLADEGEIRRIVAQHGSPRIDLGLEFLRGVRSVHLLGGGYMNSLWSRNLNMLSALSELKRRTGVEVFLTGQGLLPQEQLTRSWMTGILSEFDFVESRDAAGAAELRVRRGVDDAFLAFESDRPVYSSGEAPSTMLLLQGDFAEGTEDGSALSAAIAFIERYAPLGDFGLVEGMPPDDAKLLPELRERYPRLRFYPFAELWRDGLPARGGQRWLTSRFHFHLLAAASGAAGVAVGLKPGYYDIKHSSLLELGTGWSVVDGFTDEVEPAYSAGFPDIVTRSAQQKARLAVALYPSARISGLRSAIEWGRGTRLARSSRISAA